jgi:hypothetical protein
LKLGQRSGIVFNVSGGERNAALRKKLFRAGASKSAGAIINLDGIHGKASQKYLKFSLAFRLSNRRKDASRKDAKRAKFGETENISYFAFLAQPGRWLISLGLSLRWRDKFS